MLLPGCHVVVVKPKIGAGDGQGAWSADLGRVVYAFSMRAGKLYSIEAVPVFQSAGHGTVTLRAYERNGDGSAVRSVGAVAQEREIAACLAGQDAAGGAAVDGEFPDRSASRGEDPTASLSLSVPK